MTSGQKRICVSVCARVRKGSVAIIVGKKGTECTFSYPRHSMQCIEDERFLFDQSHKNRDRLSALPMMAFTRVLM